MDLLTKLVTEAPAWPHTTAPAAIQREAVIRDLKAAIPIRIQNVCATSVHKESLLIKRWTNGRMSTSKVNGLPGGES